MSTTKAAYKHDHPELRALLSAQLGVVTDRATVWENLGVWVGASPPGTAVTYANWVAGSIGYWGWIVIP